MAVSAPSMPKRFWPTYFVPRNFSNASAALSRSRMWRCSSGVEARCSTPSTCSWIQRFSSGSWMCMYSMPIVRQYASRRTWRMSPSVMRSVPARPPVRNSRSRSQMVRP